MLVLFCMGNFNEFLNNKVKDEALIGVLKTLASGVCKVSLAVKTSSVSKAGSTNVYGEEQLALDVLSDRIMQDECKKNPLIGLLASEEMEDEIKIGEGKFAVAYDPLDGSSLVDVNLAVGSIFGVYKFEKSNNGVTGKKTFIGKKGDDQIAAMIATYGPRTSVIAAVKGLEGVYEFTLKHESSGSIEFYLTRDDIKVSEGKMFAPGNLRACSENEKYLRLLEYWVKEQYTLRYSGGMVPDVAQILLKGKGIFSYPSHKEYPNGKLRILFECAPMAFLMEKAGGEASDGQMRILDKKIEKTDQRTPIFIGSKEEVERCKKCLFEKL